MAVGTAPRKICAWEDGPGSGAVKGAAGEFWAELGPTVSPWAAMTWALGCGGPINASGFTPTSVRPAVGSARWALCPWWMVAHLPPATCHRALAGSRGSMSVSHVPEFPCAGEPGGTMMEHPGEMV